MQSSERADGLLPESNSNAPGSEASARTCRSNHTSDRAPGQDPAAHRGMRGNQMQKVPLLDQRQDEIGYAIIKETKDGITAECHIDPDKFDIEAQLIAPQRISMGCSETAGVVAGDEAEEN